MKRYFIITYGCQANTADSENITGMLEALGMVCAPTLAEADLIIINTCSVRQASEDKVYGLAEKISKIKDQKSKLRTVLTGCLVGSATGGRPRTNLLQLRKKLPWVDFYLNINELNSLPAYLLSMYLVDEWAVKALEGKKWNAKVGNHDGNAYINVSQGCDNFCTFCVVPYSRGKEVSRPESDVLREVARAAESGFSAVSLLGQNVNSWGLTAEQKFLSRKHSGDLPFASLLHKVHAVEGIKKIKFITSNPFDFSPDLVESLRLPKIDRYLHLPVQSGSNEVLRRMGRRHSREDYLELVGEIRRSVPEIELGTDIIVGFPGESEDEFLETADIIKEVRFSVVFIAVYSARPGTAGARLFKDSLPLAEKRRRHGYLTQVWRETKK